MTPSRSPTPPNPGADAEATRAFVGWMLERFERFDTVLTTSFGMEGCALIDLVASHRRPLEIWYLDTGFFFPETLALRDRMIARYPHLRFVDRGTELSPALQAELFGDLLWQTDPDLCCHLRKVTPMRNALREADVWITAITRSQSPERAAAPLIGWDAGYQVLKINPLIDWDRARVWDYVRAHDVPHNPLHERGYSTIGCTHCTRPIAGLSPADYSRDGRWSTFAKTECGLHGPAPLTPRPE